MQIKYKASYVEPLDGFKRILQYLILSIPMHGDVILADYSQGTVAQHTTKDTLDHKLKMGGRLSKAHWYPKSPKLAPVGNEA